MHVVVVGCGRVGSELAASLEAAGHSVAVVDKSSEAFRRLQPSFGGKQVVGYGFDRATLGAAGIEEASALAAVTSGDNSNILTARVARENFGIDKVVARIYDPRRAAIFQRLGIPTVATVSWTTDQVMRRLLPSEHHSEWQDATGTVALVELAVPAQLAGTKLAALNEPGKWWLTTVTRLGTARVTTDTLVLQEGDIAHFVVEVASIPELRARTLAGRGEHG
jgi:trk system potassium uptake protein TrkA